MKPTVNKKTVLLLEDEAPLATAIKRKLEASGFDVVTAREADQGLEYLKELGGVDAIWLDHYLIGKGTGVTFVARVKSDPKWKKIPTFVVSNTASSQNVQSYINLGVNKYYIKADYRLEDIVNDLKKEMGL